MTNIPHVVFISNFMNHHQIDFCESMFQNESIHFVFIETTQLPLEKTRVGYDNYSNRKYIIHYYEESEREAAITEIGKADFVICPPNSSFLSFVKKEAVLLLFSEHIFKSKTKISCKNLLRIIKYKYLSKKIKKSAHKTFILCASCNAKDDYLKVGFSWVAGFVRWGYFPTISSYSHGANINRMSVPYRLLWVNRMIDWKHPEIALLILKQFNYLGIKSTLKFIGDGPEKKKLIAKTKKMGLENQCSFVGFLPNDKVLEEMNNSDFIISTSDRGEGWGATINEGMSFGCVPIIDSRIGCSKYLINKDNGIIYKSIGEISIPAKEELLKMSINARKTIYEVWNGKVAAENLISLIIKIYNNEEIIPDCNIIPGTLIGD